MTTFDPDSSIVDRVLNVLSQVGLLVVVNDSGSEKVKKELVDRLSGMEGIHLIHNFNNIGIAASLNVGVNQARKLKFEWVLTLDDDTLITKDYVANVFEFVGANIISNVGIVACSRVKGKGDYKIKRNLITSGSVFSIDVFDDCGGFKEGLFIDLVDFDFCARLRENGYVVVQLQVNGMQHKVGNSKVQKLLGLTIVVYNHSPFRLYYQVRNSILFFKYNFKSDFLLSFYLLSNVIKVPLKAALFEKDKITRIKLVLRGMLDGVIGKEGRCE